MIVVDTSVWVDYFNGVETPETDFLHRIVAEERILVGDIVLAEILHGFREDEEFEKALAALSKFEQAAMLSPTLAVRSAANYRFLRRKGITVRKTIDCFIATFCLEHSHKLLHGDRDFDPFERHLGLRVVHSAG